MKKLILSGLCCAGLMALLPETGRAHGGQYRGPGDVVPPSPGGGGRTGGPSGPTTGGPAGPSAPGPGAPSTGGPAAPSTGGPSGPAGGGGAPTTGGRGAALTDDLTRWDFWWEFNKDPFIRLRDAVLQGGPATGSDDYFLGGQNKSAAKDSLRPTSQQIQTEILPALKKAIDSTDQRDINSSCMVAMAKIGVDHAEFKLRDVFKPRLQKNDQEVRESAALAIGIAAIAGDEEVELLAGLALDKEVGRQAYGGTAIDNRTRSFATYGLGLTAHKTTNLEVKKKAFEAMRTLLNDEKIVDRNLKVAAIQGMSILNIGTASDGEAGLLRDVVKVLKDYYLKPLGSGEQLIQAHCPTSIAKLLGRNHADVNEFKELFADDLQDKGKVKRGSIFIPQSCALAIGLLSQPYDEKDAKKNPDSKYVDLLLEAWRGHKDVQTRNFAMVSLGFVGGKLMHPVLIKEFDKAGKNQEKPWCAMALGVLSHFRHEQKQDVDPIIGQTLADALKVAKEPSQVGALAIALGLNKHLDAADEMRTRMKDNIAKEDMAGYLCIGLALMNDATSIETIRGILPQSVRRFDLLQQAAIALGKLGDKRVAEDLQKLMTEGEPNLAKLSAIASAIGFIGDQRTIKPLKDMLFDTKLGELSRAFAAVALGGIADKEPLPWNSKIGVNSNYRAAVETLTNSQTGILDIL
jgi:HEAT repeat protein